jgi:hypothetical protein
MVGREGLGVRLAKRNGLRKAKVAVARKLAVIHGEFVRFFASVRKADRDFNIEPPASPYAIMRRVHPYRGENGGPSKDIVGKLDTQARREPRW